MLDKRVKIPMIAGIVVYGISILLSVLCALNTQAILPLFTTVEYEGNVFPHSILKSVVVLGLYIVFLVIMQAANGKYNRVIGIIMLVVYCIDGIVNLYGGFVENVIIARQGEKYLVAYSSMSTAISVVTAPFTLTAGVLIVVAIGRFGIIRKESDEEISENVSFGG